MTAGYDVQALYPDLFEGVDSDLTRQIASNFASDAQEGYEANRRDVELAVLLSTDQISTEQFKALARAEIGLPAADVES
ncbi:hypothetical protein C3B59_09325 [Cryobacterium zongtaii]|uniref:Antitoxin VbhA domain-containing protein n=1 Tax=Cryobacterium zongtaii TaxID=1259217 RepID=A0A2S3ZEI5_9MICO|nr:hypothetical protein [Cryobacterium zongtaii]POH64911.1 hypothetical protein C3B59_09325 [Cryobacterium zongtaii]